MKRTLVTTPQSAEVIKLLGPGIHAESLVLSRDEFRAIQKLYGYTKEKPTQRPPEPVDPGHDAAWDVKLEYKQVKYVWDHWKDPCAMMQAGADRNTLRHAHHDGMRLICWLARYIDPDKDPLKVLIQVVADAGWDVDASDLAWAADEEDESEGDSNG